MLASWLANATFNDALFRFVRLPVATMCSFVMPAVTTRLAVLLMLAFGIFGAAVAGFVGLVCEFMLILMIARAHLHHWTWNEVSA